MTSQPKRCTLMPAVILLLCLVLLSAGGIEVWAAGEEDASPVEPEQLVGRAVRVETEGGGVFQGTLLAVSADRLELVESDGRIVAVSRDRIERVQEIPTDRGVRAFYQDSASNRLIFAPTGFAMEPRELHVTDTELVFVTASYGLNRYVSFWGGISPVGALASARGILPLGGRLAVSAGSFVGLEWLSILGEPVAGLLLPYVLASWGEPENNLTVGCAWAVTIGGADGFRSFGLVAMVGGKIVLTATTALVSENWLIWGERSEGAGFDAIPVSGLFGLAFRIAGGRLSWDIGAVMPLGFDGGVSGLFDGTFVPLPWLSLTYRIR
ncbi:MAG: hypothetical protein JW820_05450 [Spirochaetales bacterium]|nr:hypothetical protein [Spirochaetales bacterium]